MTNMDFDKILRFLQNVLNKHKNELQNSFIVANDSGIRVV